MADPIQSFLALHEQSETPHHIPRPRHLTCCCGNDACTVLQRNHTALDALERDVDTAARLGKALLARHEAYITDSEEERKAMATQIEALEIDKYALEKKNASVIEENRSLLNQLEALNNAVAQSDEHVTSLQATLASTQREMQKLAQLAARTETLERQLADFEREQEMLQSTLSVTEQSERSAVRRWQTAERTLAQLQEQIEQIDKEAKEERERHAEIVARMERRRAVESELGSAAGRLKSAAALKSGDRDASSTGVVSHFVKDILQDNANLQMGIVELREMLNNSNEEVENLRGQLSLHQPADEAEEAPQAAPDRKNLSLELNRTTSQELHVHHHYHAPPTAPKPPPLRRPKKKYRAFVAGQSTPSSGASTPRSSFSYGTPTSATTILQQTAASVPQPASSGKRWSIQSNQTFHSMVASSGPSSPRSATNRTSSIFDRVFSDAGQDSSRPTTPDTEDPGSPLIAPVHSKRAPGAWSRTHSAPITQRHVIGAQAARPSLDAIMSIEELPKLEQASSKEEPIVEEDENSQDHEWSSQISPMAEATSSTVASPLSDDFRDQLQEHGAPRPPLRRANSHESLLSISGMDIHTLQHRPSQLLAPYAGRALTSQAVISGTNAHAARPVAMSRNTTTGRSILSGMASEQRQPPKPTFGKKVGGWVFGRWGATPAPTAAENAPATSTVAKKLATTTAEATSAASTAAKKPASVVSDNSDQLSSNPPLSPRKLKVRTPGINQPGAIEGFFPEVKPLPSTPVLKSFDEEALANLLNGK